MTNKLAHLIQRTTVPYTLSWGLAAILLGLLVYSHASLNWTAGLLLAGAAGLLGLWPRRLAPERPALLRGLNLLANLANLAALALFILQNLGRVFYHP